MRLVAQHFWLIFVLCVLFLCGVFFSPVALKAALVDDLKNKINTHNEQIKNLEAEIDQYKKQVETISKETQTLQSTVKSLDIVNKQLSTDIKVTKNKIDATSLSVEKLNIEIADKEAGITGNVDAIAETIRRVNESESQTLVESVFASEALSDVWNDIESLERFQQSMQESVALLKAAKIDLEAARQEKETAKKSLVVLTTQLADRQIIVKQNRTEKNTLLQQTKNKESEYKKLLEEKKRLKDLFERELLDFESQLKIAIDPSLFPSAGTRVFAWPLSKIYVTQLFGGTAFAAANPQVYGRPFHNGVDFGTPSGSEVKTVLSGTVKGTGNTDLIHGCYSYGKWVLVEHFNGLSTLYAHLSLIKVQAGDKVSTGDLIAYSGSTGYSTGPHLHFTVYATAGVKIMRFGDIKTVTNCANAYLPIASTNAYLDPLPYLPPL